MNLTFDKNSFVYQFLLPLSKLTDNIILNISKDSICATCSTADAGVVVCAEYLSKFDIEKDVVINLPDIKKFLKLLENLDDANINLLYKSNHLSYNNKKIKFNYYLLEDGYVQRCPVSAAKIKNLTHDSEFNFTSENLAEVLRGHSIATDASKVYFFIKDNEVFAELNDREKQNINTIEYHITDEYKGQEFAPIAINLESIRMLLGLRNQTFNVKINNTLKVFLFDINDINISIRFAISALVK